MKRKRQKSAFDSVIRFIKFRILHVDDSPHRIALGVALGLFVGWTPLVGLQMLIALVFAVILRANKFLAVTLVWASNVFTIFIIYYPNYVVGKKILAAFRGDYQESSRGVAISFSNLFSFSNVLTDFYRVEFWQQLWKLFVSIGGELFVGGFVIGSLVSVCCYFATLYLVRWYRRTHPHRRFVSSC